VPNIPSIKLNNGVEMPQLGFGVFQVPQQETFDAVTAASQRADQDLHSGQGDADRPGPGHVQWLSAR
jgi:2,5-diketo-D-gluconate reductase A